VKSQNTPGKITKAFRQNDDLFICDEHHPSATTEPSPDSLTTLFWALRATTQ